MIITGSNLTDLMRGQVDLEANAARERIAQAQAAAAAAQAQQQRYFQQSQAQQQDALARAQMQQQADLENRRLTSSDFFNRGRLTNEADALKAQLASAQGQQFWKSSEAQKDRDVNLKIAGERYPAADWHSQQLAAQQAEIANAANNYANILNEHEKAQNDLNALGVIDATRKARGDETWTWNSTAEKEALPKLAPFFAGGTNTTAGLPYSAALEQAKKALSDKVTALAPFIAGGQQSGAAQYVVKGPDGRWVSTIRTASAPATTSTNGFFNAPASVTNAVPSVQRWNFVPGQGLVPAQ